MRVAFVVPYLRMPSGWRSFSVGAIRAIQACTDITPIVFVDRQDANQARELLPACDLIVVPGTQSLALHVPKLWPTVMATYWHVKCRRFPKIDLVHSLEAYPTGLVGNWLASRLHVPHVITTIGAYAAAGVTSGLDHVMYGQVFRRVNFICPISNGTLALVRRHLAEIVSEAHLQVILPGTDYHRQVLRDVALERVPSSEPTILSVGAIKPRKGYLTSLQAFAKVKEKLPSARYWIVGKIHNRDYYERLQTFITEHQLQGVDFLGEISDVRLQQCYREATAFLLTPQREGFTPDGFMFEGFGLVYLEAGAYGLPVVGTRTGGVPDAVKDGETGLLAEPDDIDALANALLQLLTNADLARRMGSANRDWAEELTWERYAREQVEVYRKVIY